MISPARSYGSSGTISGSPTDAFPHPHSLESWIRRAARRSRNSCGPPSKSHATFGWEVNVQCNGQLTGLLLFAAVTDVGIIICGTRSRAGLNESFDEMMRIQNEQVNALRTSLKAEQLEAATHRQREEDTLEEFSRLNNELVNTQRKLARLNADLAVANARLESLATTDGLTGLKNHRAFQESLEREYARAARDGSPLSLLLLDVDHFKQFNDQFGHPAGDGALKDVARILAESTRLSDTLVGAMAARSSH